MAEIPNAEIRVLVIDGDKFDQAIREVAEDVGSQAAQDFHNLGLEIAAEYTKARREFKLALAVVAIVAAVFAWLGAAFWYYVGLEAGRRML